MTDWQTIIAAAMFIAVVCGLPSARLAAVMAGNLVATMALNGDPLAVAVADMVCAAILLTGPAREKVIAALFVAMIPVYIAGRANGWPDTSTYAIIDGIALVQIAVMGNVDGGMGRGIRAIGRWGAGLWRYLAWPRPPVAAHRDDMEEVAR